MGARSHACGVSESMRRQLIEARDNLRRQIEILQSPAAPAGVVYIPDNREMIASLEAQIRELPKGPRGEKRPADVIGAAGNRFFKEIREPLPHLSRSTPFGTTS